MAQNIVSSGEVITIPCPSGGCTSGDLVIVTGLMGIAQTTQLINEPVALWREVVVDLPKTTTETWVVGEVALWDTGTSKLLKAGAISIGVITKAVLAGDTTGRVALFDQPVTV